MNELLQLKGRFEQQSSNGRPGAPSLLAHKEVTSSQLLRLKKELEILKEYWIKIDYFEGALITTVYIDVVAKSRRIKELFKKSNKRLANDFVVGAKFLNEEKHEERHAITYYIDMQVLDNAIQLLEKSQIILDSDFGGEITTEIVNEINSKKRIYDNELLSKTTFLQIIVDVSSIDRFDIPQNEFDSYNTSIISIFETELKTTDLLKKIGLDIPVSRIIDNATILLNPDELSLLNEKAPYLIAMATVDISKLDSYYLERLDSSGVMSIPLPSNEPVVGVIDTLFDESVYFSKWVTFESKISSDIQIVSSDYIHGTAVTSIIVDGSTINPELDDNCGRFRVKHFGVAIGGRFSSFTILKSIREIVAENRDIKVWNLSLGSALEINKNFISPEAAFLDKLQYEYDVLFIIAGTNKKSNEKQSIRIGAPADSINSLVVNAVNKKGQPTSYSRKGKVLSFFKKPDICYFGGDGRERIRVCTPTGESFVTGTSFAAPWITRKVAYLIHKIGLSREVAKALIIDSAISWEKTQEDANLIGYGVVPQKIEDVINTPDDEIKFVLSGKSLKYDTYNYNLPIPVVDEKHPYIAKATLCYFPKCSRNQGVDYTNTELDIYFGRINGQKIVTINDNKQSDNVAMPEKDGRGMYRKWDNIKSIVEFFKPTKRAKKAYENGLWGFSIRTKERLNANDGENLKFGIVVTLKEIKGVNRISDFINQCSMRGWLVNRVNVEEMIDIYNVAEEEISFDE
ncbi:TPA: S8 family peptidase [Streptococcus mutans]|uniref:S8 family peptidase n=1 Tax=Streptococcus mutans TaxID=1309 RepID=UPI00081C229C|nr:S8 family peptidase [Streptococcus mutans]MCB4974487.1 S8 family peptidase [Streptococcus mutans]MCB5016874.1 S8 family peptidase [Streptococcus mutans]MCB5022022.1 S8 family peptidase [Streptococcus mutans]MCB5083531.1 S8 family peptidase [Streptococcus mutans]MCB5087710.1 S8 family peptidase [Streptococcus mutans]